MEAKHKFAWGDTRGIRALFLQRFPLPEVVSLGDCGYPPHEGYPILISNTKKLIEQLTGQRYKYVLITSGCTQGVQAAIHALSNSRTEEIVTPSLYFPFYPGIIEQAGLTHQPKDYYDNPTSYQLLLLDSPNNPTGNIAVDHSANPSQTIWDAAYHSPTYGASAKMTPKHAIACGSLNKMTGLNGLRVGWVATNSKEHYESMLDYITYDACAVNHMGQQIANTVLQRLDLIQLFFNESKCLLDSNRTELSKLSKIFGNQPIPIRGMFTLFETDDRLDLLLAHAGVETMPAYRCGSKVQGVRINMSNSVEDTANMVKDILKTDRRKK